MTRLQVLRAGTTGAVTIRDGAFDGVKIFSATIIAQREKLGETVTEWIGRQTNLEIVEFVVVQSSDSSYHCVTICVFHRRREDVGRTAPNTRGTSRREFASR
jgi:hypothetical protein